jgi:hypothetical protein
LLASLLTVRAHGATVVFTVDATQSALDIAPSLTLPTVNFQTTPQGAGSWTTHYSGTITAEVTATSFQILSANLIAANSGNWLPGIDYSNYPGDLNDPNGYVLTPQPANYGIITDLTPLGTVNGVQGPSPSAIRNLQINLSDASAKVLSGGAFDESGSTTHFSSGIIFYASGGSPPITDLVNTVTPGPTLDIANLSGTLSASGGTQTLTLPLSFNLNFPITFLQVNDLFSGTIVATAPLPEPSSACLFGVGALVLFGARRVQSLRFQRTGRS